MHAKMKIEHKDIRGLAEINRWLNLDVFLAIVFFFKQKTAYEIGQ